MLEVKSDITLHVSLDTEMLKPSKHPQSACKLLCFVINCELFNFKRFCTFFDRKKIE